MFSKLSQSFIYSPPNPFAIELEKIKRSNKKVIDLVDVHWYEEGITFDSELLQSAYEYGIRQSKSYWADPSGLFVLREAIANWYQQQGYFIDAEQVIITPGTSYAYWAIFKLLGNAHSTFLIPTPGYPLFDTIASIADVELSRYSLHYDAPKFVYDCDSILEQVRLVNPCGIIVISPHNPTGSEFDQEIGTQLLHQLSANKKLIPLIVDEVFESFRYQFHSQFQVHLSASFRGWLSEYPLSFLLNGVSKLLALPSHKIGWIIVNGTKQKVGEAKLALEHILDAFLPIPDVTQYAIQYLFTLDNGKTIMSEISRISKIVMQRKQFVYDFSHQHRLKNLIVPMNGTYCWFLLETNQNEDEHTIRLIQNGLVFHPGYFYDFNFPCLVFTSLCKPETLENALTSAFLKIGGDS